MAGPSRSLLLPDEDVETHANAAAEDWDTPHSTLILACTHPHAAAHPSRNTQLPANLKPNTLVLALQSLDAVDEDAGNGDDTVAADRTI